MTFDQLLLKCIDHGSGHPDDDLDTIKSEAFMEFHDDRLLSETQIEELAKEARKRFPNFVSSIREAGQETELTWDFIDSSANASRRLELLKEHLVSLVWDQLDIFASDFASVSS